MGRKTEVFFSFFLNAPLIISSMTCDVSYRYDVLTTYFSMFALPYTFVWLFVMYSIFWRFISDCWSYKSILRQAISLSRNLIFQFAVLWFILTFHGVNIPPRNREAHLNHRRYAEYSILKVYFLSQIWYFTINILII